MTVDELLERISSEELSEWRIVWLLRHEEFEQQKAELESRAR